MTATEPQPMTEAEKTAMLQIVDDMIRKWINDDVHAEGAMFTLRDEMAKRGFPKHFAPMRRAANSGGSPP